MGSLQKLITSRPAIFAWIAGLVFGFGLNAFDVMSFYFLFIPTWLFTLIVYTIMAKMNGASEDYTEEIKEEEQLQKEIIVFQAEQAKTEKAQPKDTSVFSKVLNYSAIACLLVIIVLAGITMFGSPNMESYILNKEIFHKYSFYLTIGYFGLAYWALRRKNH